MNTIIKMLDKLERLLNKMNKVANNLNNNELSIPPLNLQAVEIFLHKHTGIEFAGGKNGIFGLQCTDSKRYKQFIKKYKGQNE